MHKRILILAVLVALVVSFVVYARSRPQQRITEDDPRWDCRTMGNKICGPSPTPTPKPVITCAGITKKNAPCKRRVKKQGDYCWQHKPK